MSLIPYGKTTLGEKLDLFLSIGVALMKAAYCLLRYPFVADPGRQRTLDREIGRTIVRTLLDRVNPAQIHWALPSSTAAYEKWIATRAKGEDVPTEVVSELIGNEGLKIFWIGNKAAKKVVVHFHGGGFVMPLFGAHISVVNYLRKEIKRRSGIEVKVAFPDYSLSPQATYPTQFRQAVLALQHILDLGFSPADILISGDSCGGMLAMQVLSHILHPHPLIPAIRMPAVPFAGILAISCWVVFDSDAPSFIRNERDVLSKIPLLSWGRLIRQGNVLADNQAEPGGYWIEPLKAPPEWWCDTAKVTKRMLFTYGEWEGLRDDIVALVEKVKSGIEQNNVEVTSVEEPKGIHESPMLDAAAGRAPNDLSKIIAGWVVESMTG